MTDQLGGAVAQHVVAAADLYRLARQPDCAVHQIGIPFGPQKLLHAAERAADDQPQMGDLQPVRDQPVRQVDHVVVAVVWELTLETIGRF